jgi:hypothetical protein
LAVGWRRLLNEELHNLYASPNIWVIKSRRMGWTEYLALMGKMGNAYNKIRLESQKGRNHLEDLGIGGKIILEWFLGK